MTATTISDAERREAARRLREANVRRNFYSPWCKMVEAVLDGTDCGEDDGTCDEDACCERFMKRMADLIEPEPDRTCQDVEGGDFFRCSKCGCELMRVADGWRPLYMGEVNYCPNCGAKVVEK